jgi:hypothetical protein
MAAGKRIPGSGDGLVVGLEGCTLKKKRKLPSEESALLPPCCQIR